MATLLVLALLLLPAGFVDNRATAQKFTVSKSPVRPFEPGEELIYKAEISRSVLRKIDVATFRFVATQMEKSGASGADANTKMPLRFVGDVASDGFFVRLFNINFHQHIESTVDPDSLGVLKTVKLDEQGKRKRTSEAIFDQGAGKVTWTENDANDPSRPPRTVTGEFSGLIHDVVSAIYFLRTLHLDSGKTVDVPISDSGRVYNLKVQVMERKRVKTVIGKVPVIRVDPQLFGEKGMINAKGQFTIWMTDDQRHLPVSAQVKTEQGTFDITLRKVTSPSFASKSPSRD